jgi:calcineurin-like phosphoesterase family protein
MTNRQKEELELEKCKDAELSHSQEISSLISSKLRKRRNIWITTDWHLWTRVEKNKSECHKRLNFNNIIETYQKIDQNDLLIILGDLVDGEFINEKALRDVILSIPCTKILVRGNNDLFNYQFYRSCGFRYITRSFVWNDILFSHMPLENDNKINMHGHLHGYRTYWIPYRNQIDVFNKERVPVKLFDIIKEQPEYAKTIKVKWDKVESVQESVFENCMDWYSYFILKQDPYPDTEE